MMNPPTSSPRTSSFPSPESARLLAAQAAKDAAMTMQGSGSQNANNANAALLDKINKERPVMSKPPGFREGYTREQMQKFNTTPKTGIPAVPQPTYLEPEIPNMQMENVQKKGGTHKMPNGKIMLNSAMKKKTSKKK